MTGFHDVSWCEGYAKAKKARAKFAVGMVHVFCGVMIREMNLVINLVVCFLWLPVPSGYMRLLQERIERSRLLSARVPGLQISPGTSTRVEASGKMWKDKALAFNFRSLAAVQVRFDSWATRQNQLLVWWCLVWINTEPIVLTISYDILTESLQKLFQKSPLRWSSFLACQWARPWRWRASQHPNCWMLDTHLKNCISAGHGPKGPSIQNGSARCYDWEDHHEDGMEMDRNGSKGSNSRL